MNLQDYDEIARQMVQNLRGRHPRQALSERLGYSTNALYTWETGIAYPAASRFFALAEALGLSSETILRSFLASGASQLTNRSLSSPGGVRALLVVSMGATKITELAKASGLSRYSIGRWLKGKAEPKLPQLLHFIAYATLRLPDFVDAITDVRAIAQLRQQWKVLQAARSAGYDLPLSHAVLRAVETTTYTRSSGSAAALAEMLGVSRRLVHDCLERLEQGEQIRKMGTHWVPGVSSLVDFRREPGAAQKAKAYWAQFAAERTEKRREGLFSYNVFAVSQKDYAQLEAIHREHLARMRTIIAGSEPTDVVVLMNLQLFALHEKAEDEQSTKCTS